MAANKFLLSLSFFLSFLVVWCQEELEKVSIVFEKQTLIEALVKLDDVTRQHLSYNPQTLPTSVVVDRSFEQMPPKLILQEILGSNYQIKIVGNYLIIQKAPASKKDKTTFELSGGVRDAKTGEQLKDVSIYEVNSLKSTLSDENGAFDLKASTGISEVTFVISKRFYQDTIIRVTKQGVIGDPIVLKSEKEIKNHLLIRERVSKFSKGIASFFTSNENRKHAENINFTDTRWLQVSLVPSIGTNRKMSSQIRNIVSMNAISGYAYGVRGLELGGVYNMDRKEVHGVQLGGLGNIVGGEVNGLQMGGFINTTKDYVHGAQIGGVINVASDSVRGLQMGGVTNITKEMKGVQIAGFSNHNKETSGMMLSSFLNTTATINGLQLSGLLNVAGKVNGLQFSLINVADSVSSGIQFGLLNITMKNGFISPALESDDIALYRFAFRSGLHRFYSMLGIGIKPNEYWTAEIGFGSRFFMKKNEKIFLNPELKWLNLLGKIPNKEKNNFVLRFNFNVGYQLFKHLSIASGPSFSLYITDQLNEFGEPELSLGSRSILDGLIGESRYQGWLGYTISIGF